MNRRIKSSFEKGITHDETNKIERLNKIGVSLSSCCS